ncbi:MAG: multidrug effflux MFS transporter [Dehalococcoidia bacterium]
MIGLVAIAPVSIDMFLPSMPDMAREFETSTGSISLAVTLFLFAFAASQLFFGPASDRFGRRPVLLAGLGLYTLGTVISLFSSSVGVLVAGRILQGAGGGAGPAVATAVVIDVYRRERATQVLAVMAMVMALAPMLSPIAGGVLHDLFGWRSVFVTLLAVGGVLTSGCLLLLPETVPERDRSALEARRMAANYRRLFSSPVYVSHALLIALLFSGQLVFISSSSFVLIDELGLTPGLFGVGFGFVALGIMAGAALARRLAPRWPPDRIILLAVVGGGTASATMACLALVGAAGALFIVLPMFLVTVGNGLVRPPAMASALVPFPETAGLASAVLGFAQIALASVYSIAFNGLLTPGSETMTAAIAAASLAALILALSVAIPTSRAQQREVMAEGA